MKVSISFIFCLIVFSSAWSQSGIHGNVTDRDTGEDVIGANISFKKDSRFIMGCATDFDGNYKVNIDPGVYDVIMCYIGYPDKQINGVMVKEGQTTRLDIQTSDPLLMSGYTIITCFDPPLLHLDDPTSKEDIKSIKIKRTPTRNIKHLSSLAAGISFQN